MEENEHIKPGIQKDIFSGVNEAMATISDREYLFHFMMNKIRPVIKFQEAVIVEVSANQMHHKTFLTISPDSTKAHPNYDKIVGNWLPVNGEVVFWTLSQKEDLFFSHTNELLQLYPDSIIVNLMKDASLNHSLILKLHWSGVLRGFVVFHFTKKPKIDIKKTKYYKSIANQISMALLNIIANEDILERQKEKELLLKISEAIIAIRDRDVLFSTLMTHIKPIINFDDAAVVELNNNKTHYHLFLTMSPATTMEHPTYKEIIRRWLPMEQGMVSWLLEQEGDVVVSNIDNLLKLYPNNNIINSMKELSLEHSLSFKLRSSGLLKALLIFSFRDKQKLNLNRTNLYKSIANHISMALVNIIANEDIYRREKEKELLLNISEQLSKVRNWDDLFNDVFSILQSVFNFKEATITHLNSSGSCTCKVFKSIDGLGRTSKIANLEFEKPFYFIQICSYKKPKLLTIQDYEELSPGIERVKSLKNSGIQASWVQSLQYGNSNKTTLEFHYISKEKANTLNVSLFKNVVNQLSVTVANILTNENILESEKIKNLRAKLALALTSKPNWPSRFMDILHSLKEVIPFDYISFLIDIDDNYAKGYGFEKIGFDEYRLISTKQFYKQSGKTEEEYRKKRFKIPYKRSKIYNAKDFENNIKKDEVKNAISRLYKVKSNLNIPLKLTIDGYFQLSFYSKDINGYTIKHLNIMNQLVDSIIHPLEKVLAYNQISQLNSLLEQEKDYLIEEIKDNHNFEEIIGNSKEIKQVFFKISQVANADTTVLVTGETGTGKELIARAIHNVSSRSDKTLIKLNCAVLPPQLLESELFGHEKGAFTGAEKRRIGKFELAHKSTIFLDEIGELPIALQAKLLRIIQEKEFERLGGNEVIKTNVRVIAATNRKLKDEIFKGNFRSDLFFRLNVFPIKLPPLRERPEDIPLLSAYFLEKKSKQMGKRISSISSSSLKKLMGYNWPGNIRELEHVIERAILLNKGSILSINLEKQTIENNVNTSNNPFRVKTLKNAERELILNTLKFCGGKIRGAGGAAELLDINPTTLDSRIKKLGITKTHIFKE